MTKGVTSLRLLIERGAVISPHSHQESAAQTHLGPGGCGDCDDDERPACGAIPFRSSPTPSRCAVHVEELAFVTQR